MPILVALWLLIVAFIDSIRLSSEKMGLTNPSECRQRSRRWGDWVCGYWLVDGTQICGAWQMSSWVPPVRGGEEGWESGCVWNEQRSMTQKSENTLMRPEKIKIKSHSFLCCRYILSGHENLSLCSYKYTMFSKNTIFFLKRTCTYFTHHPKYYLMSMKGAFAKILLI